MELTREGLSRSLKQEDPPRSKDTEEGSFCYLLSLLPSLLHSFDIRTNFFRPPTQNEDQQLPRNPPSLWHNTGIAEASSLTG